jgi:DNA-binding NarL/FixJ family response regulator
MNSPAKRPRVLVVDDDTLMREVLKALLRDEGFDVVGEARDGQSALALPGADSAGCGLPGCQHAGHDRALMY